MFLNFNLALHHYLHVYLGIYIHTYLSSSILDTFTYTCSSRSGAKLRCSLMCQQNKIKKNCNESLLLHTYLAPPSFFICEPPPYHIVSDIAKLPHFVTKRRRAACRKEIGTFRSQGLHQYRML